MTSKDRYFELVETAYDFTEDPAQFEDLLEVASSYLFDSKDGTQIASDLPRFSKEDPRLESHLNRLSRLLDQTLNTENSPEEAQNVFFARISVKTGGSQVNGNAGAEKLMGISFPCPLENLPLDHRTMVMIKSFALRKSPEQQDRKQVLLASIEEPEFRTCLMTLAESEAEDSALELSFSYVDWDDSLLAALSDAFSLTQKETDVLRGYLGRMTQKEIAEQSDRSIETIKAQSKSILRKTSCARMSDVVELSAGIAYLMTRQDTGSQLPATGEWVTPTENLFFLDRPDGRKLAYYRHGGGDQAVIFLHGFVFGPFFETRFLSAIERGGFDLIAPSRAGFGYSSPAKSRENYDQAVTEDHVALINDLALDNVIILAHQGGVSHAFRLARALEDRVRCMVMVSAGVPIDDTRHVPNMDVHSRIGAVTARHAPSVLKFMTQLSIPVYKRQGAEAFLRKLYASSPPDMRSVHDPAILRALIAGIYHICQQGAETWVRDAQSAMADWHADFDAVSTFQHWIHGEKCPVLAASFVEEYVSSRTNFPVEVVEDMGVTLLYQMPEKIVELLKRVARD